MRRTTMNRREILKTGGALAITSALPVAAFGEGAFAPTPGTWRSFQTVTRLEIARHGGAMQAWVPLPAFDAPDWFRPGGSTWKASSGTAEIKREAKYGAE